MKRHILFNFLFSLIIITAANCKGEESGNDNDSNEIIPNVDKTFKFKNKLFSIPSPFHITDLIKEISTSYNYDLLNPTENKLNYSTTEKKALNLGIYTADLGYTNVYEQFSHTTNYIKVVRSLSSDLQIMNAYTEEILSKLEENQHNKDTLNRIFAESYRETDIYLTDNERGELAVLILTGAWTEGLYLMTRVCNENPNELLLNRIGEQKYSLSNIIKLLSQYKMQKSESFSVLIDKLKELEKTFNKVKITYTYDKHIVLPNEKKTIILSNTKIEINQEVLKEISHKVKKLRDYIIK